MLPFVVKPSEVGIPWKDHPLAVSYLTDVTIQSVKYQWRWTWIPDDGIYPADHVFEIAKERAGDCSPAP